MNRAPGSGALAPADWGEPPARLAPAPAQTRVAVYHGRTLARAALVSLLTEHAFEVVGAAPLHSERQPLAAGADVALVGAGGHGVNIVHRLGYELATPVLMMVEEPPDEDSLLAATTAGANGCVCHECPPERVVRGLRAVAAGGTFFECRHEPGQPAVAVPALLSERERHVVGELAAGAQAEEIAAALCISPHTVRTHVRNIKRKLDARTTAQAVAMAISLRLLGPRSRSPLGRPPRSRA